MKLLSTIFTIFAASTAFSYSIDVNMIKRQSPQTNNNAAVPTANQATPNQAQVTVDKTVIQKCEVGIKEYSQCLSVKEKITTANIDKYCETFNTDKCQKIFKEGMVAAVPACADIPDIYKNKSKLKYDTLYYTFKLLCAKDEGGNYCPVSKAYLSGGNKSFAKEGFSTTLSDTCRSKKCTDEANEAFNILNNSNILENLTQSQAKHYFIKGKDEISSVLIDLKSSNCTSQAVNNPIVVADGSNNNGINSVTPNSNTNEGEPVKDQASSAVSGSTTTTTTLIIISSLLFLLF